MICLIDGRARSILRSRRRRHHSTGNSRRRSDAATGEHGELDCEPMAMFEHLYQPHIYFFGTDLPTRSKSAKSCVGLWVLLYRDRQRFRVVHEHKCSKVQDRHGSRGCAAVECGMGKYG
jgi:hypothetical protein